MRRLCLYIPLLVLVLLAPAALYAQAPAWSAVVPRVIRLTGTFVPASGLTPSPVETVTLAIFADVGVTVLVILNSLRLTRFNPTASLEVGETINQ